jgi:hypothetical protein
MSFASAFFGHESGSPMLITRLSEMASFTIARNISFGDLDGVPRPHRAPVPSASAPSSFTPTNGHYTSAFGDRPENASRICAPQQKDNSTS